MKLNKICTFALFLTLIAGTHQNAYASKVCENMNIRIDPVLDIDNGSIDDEQKSVISMLRDDEPVLSSGRSESPTMIFRRMVGSWEDGFASPLMQDASCGEWETYAEKSFARGDGLSADTAFEIETPEQLAYLSVQTNFSDKSKNRPFYYYKLVSDIDLEIHFWDSIGIKDNRFFGCFDGNGHTISNLNIHKCEVSGQGLFGYVQDGSVIKNTTLNNFFISADFYAGGIIGQGQNINVENCTAINGAVMGDYNFIGGIIGDATGSSISNCYVESVSTSGSFLVGLICGNQDNVNCISCSDYLQCH